MSIKILTPKNRIIIKESFAQKRQWTPRRCVNYGGRMATRPRPRPAPRHLIANRRDLKRPTNTLTSDASLPPPRSLSSTSTNLIILPQPCRTTKVTSTMTPPTGTAIGTASTLIETPPPTKILPTRSLTDQLLKRTPPILNHQPPVPPPPSPVLRPPVTNTDTNTSTNTAKTNPVTTKTNKQMTKTNPVTKKTNPVTKKTNKLTQSKRVKVSLCITQTQNQTQTQTHTDCKGPLPVIRQMTLYTPCISPMFSLVSFPMFSQFPPMFPPQFSFSQFSFSQFYFSQF